MSSPSRRDDSSIRPSGSVYPHDLLVETVELFGNAVIPEFDTDPEFSTDKYRAGSMARPLG
jgi:hypothetical protein